jgi:hypothetical protein
MAAFAIRLPSTWPDCSNRGKNNPLDMECLL